MSWIDVNNRTPELNRRVLLKLRSKKGEFVHTEGYLEDQSETCARPTHPKEFWVKHGYGLCYFDYAGRKLQDLKAKKNTKTVTQWMDIPK